MVTPEHSKNGIWAKVRFNVYSRQRDKMHAFDGRSGLATSFPRMSVTEATDGRQLMPAEKMLLSPLPNQWDHQLPNSASLWAALLNLLRSQTGGMYLQAA